MALLVGSIDDIHIFEAQAIEISRVLRRPPGGRTSSMPASGRVDSVGEEGATLVETEIGGVAHVEIITGSGDP
jgi:hypothetical protein